MKNKNNKFNNDNNHKTMIQSKSMSFVMTNYKNNQVTIFNKNKRINSLNQKVNNNNNNKYNNLR